MAWSNGKFTRTNGDHIGPKVWRDDAANNHDIEADRHDVHDQDLADGIDACLPADGSKPMQGSLDMGGHTLQNLSAGEQDGDIATVGQTVTSASYDRNTGQLSLARPSKPDISVSLTDIPTREQNAKNSAESAEQSKNSAEESKNVALSAKASALNAANTSIEVAKNVFFEGGKVGPEPSMSDFILNNVTANTFIAKEAKYFINGQVVTFPQQNISLTPAPNSQNKVSSYDLVLAVDDGTYIVEQGVLANTTPESLGYVKSSYNRYTKGGRHFALIIGITRLNQGAYHPILNPLGCSYFQFSVGGGGSATWHNAPFSINSIADCFDSTKTYTGTQGKIGTTSYRPDGAHFDAVYEWQVNDLRLPAKSINQPPSLFLQSLIDNRGRGWEGLPVLRKYLGTGNSAAFQVFYHSTNKQIQLADPFRSQWGNKSKTSTFISFAFVQGGNMVYGKARYVSYSAGGGFLYELIEFTDTGYPSGAWQTTGEAYITELSDVKFSTLPLNDFMGAPSKIKSLMDSVNVSSILGASWMIQVPDATSKAFKASRKVISYKKAFYTQNNGVSWTDVTSAYSPGMTSPDNAHINTVSADTVAIETYTTTAFALESAVQASVDDAQLSDATLLAAHNHDYGSVLCSNTTGTVSTNVTAPMIFSGLNLQGYIVDSQNYGGLISSQPQYLPSHDKFTLGGTRNGAKVFSYLHTDSNGLTWGYVVSKQIKYKAGSGFGDNEKFNIVNNVSSVTDDNGEKVIVGCWRTKHPLGFAGE